MSSKKVKSAFVMKKIDRWKSKLPKSNYKNITNHPAHTSKELTRQQKCVRTAQMRFTGPKNTKLKNLLTPHTKVLNHERPTKVPQHQSSKLNYTEMATSTPVNQNTRNTKRKSDPP